MWVLIDNYDSFTHILHHYLLLTGNDCVVFRNNEISVDALQVMRPDRIIISPGPETPRQAGITMDVIDRFHKTTPILGVCLGHQALGMYFGARLVHAPRPMHGKISQVRHFGGPLFANVAPLFPVMRYHSLILTDPPAGMLTILAETADERINMAIAHKEYPSIGIQFHPESVGTGSGFQILQNWAAMY